MRNRIPNRTAIRVTYAGLIVLALAGCSDRRAVSPAVSSSEFPDQEVTEFAITETDEGRVEWKLYARDASTYSARNLIIAHVVRIDFYDEQGAKSSELVARQGEINQRTRNMTARGDVVLATRDGTRLSTQELLFLNQEQKIVVPENQKVRVEKGGDVLTGYGFESDPDLTHFEFKRSVRATVRSDAGDIVRPRDEGE